MKSQTHNHRDGPPPNRALYLPERHPHVVEFLGNISLCDPFALDKQAGRR
jgi:hypothetical protein